MPILRATMVVCLFSSLQCIDFSHGSQVRIERVFDGWSEGLYPHVQPAISMLGLSSSRMRRKLLRYLVDKIGPVMEKNQSIKGMDEFQRSLVEIILAEGFRQDLYPPELYATICWFPSCSSKKEPLSTDVNAG